MMKLFLNSASIIIALVFSGLTQAQTLQPSPEGAKTTGAQTSQLRVLGEVSAINPPNNQVILKTAEGRLITVLVNAKTLYRRVAPGETTLERASVISFEDIGAGDRVLARGEATTDKDSLLAHVLIVIAKTDIANKRAQDRAEWNRRGIMGRVTALNPDTKEITVLARERDGNSRALIIQAGGNVRFRRYSQNSVRFRDSTESSFAELRVGDQLRALGDKSADGLRLTPEEIIYGSFRSISGVITEIKAESNEVVVKDTKSSQQITLKLNDDSMLRRLSPELLKLLEQSMAANSASNASGAQKPSGGTPATGADIQSAIEKLAPISISNLKPGESLLAMSTQGTNPSNATAVILVTGVDSLFKAQGAQSQRGLDLILGLPSGVSP